MKTASISLFLFALIASTGAQAVDDNSSSDSSSDSSSSSLASSTGTVTSAAASASPTLSACATACIAQAANSTGCTGVTDVQCLCTNAQFQENAKECLNSQCASDAPAAMALQSQQCGTSYTVTGTATTGSFRATGIPTAATSSAARTATSLKAATSSASHASGAATSTSKPNSAEKVILASGAGTFAFGLVMILGMGVGSLL